MASPTSSEPGLQMKAERVAKIYNTCAVVTKETAKVFIKGGRGLVMGQERDIRRDLRV